MKTGGFGLHLMFTESEVRFAFNSEGKSKCWKSMTTIILKINTKKEGAMKASVIPPVP